MDDAAPMRVAQCSRYLGEYAHCFANRQPAVRREKLLHRLATDERHDVVEQSVRRARSENGYDVRMLELRRELDLLPETGRAYRAREVGRQHLDDDLAVE